MTTTPPPDQDWLICDVCYRPIKPGDEVGHQAGPGRLYAGNIDANQIIGGTIKAGAVPVGPGRLYTAPLNTPFPRPVGRVRRWLGRAFRWLADRADPKPFAGWVDLGYVDEGGIQFTADIEDDLAEKSLNWGGDSLLDTKGWRPAVSWSLGCPESRRALEDELADEDRDEDQDEAAANEPS